MAASSCFFFCNFFDCGVVVPALHLLSTRWRSPGWLPGGGRGGGQGREVAGGKVVAVPAPPASPVEGQRKVRLSDWLK